MVSNILSSVALSSTSISMVALLIKATLILVVALGITLSMQRASAGARHLVWLVTLATLLLVPALTAWGPIPLRILPPTASVAPAIAPSVTGSPPRIESPKSNKSATRAPIATANRPAIALEQELA